MKGGVVTDKTRACAVSMVGAVIGAAVGYLFFTDRGRELRRQLEKTLETLEPELSHFSGTINRTASVASEGWKLLNEALGESSRAPRYVNPHQTSPF
jgi:gas vesicle protein